MPAYFIDNFSKEYSCQNWSDWGYNKVWVQ